MWLLTQEKMTQAGYVPVGFDHYALPNDALAVATGRGRLHRNFMGYTTLPDVDLVGLGCSAISQVGRRYWQVDPKLGSWLRCVDQGEGLVRRAMVLSDEDLRRSRLIREVMCQLEVTLHPSKDADALRELGGPRGAEGLAVRGERVRLSEAARPLARLVAATLDQYLPPPGPRRGSRLI